MDLRELLRQCPVIASVQADKGSPLDDAKTLLAAARASLQEGVKVLRLQGVENINLIKSATGVPVIGLIKRECPGSEVYITPTSKEVAELISTGCEIIALDSTERARPNGEKLEGLVAQVKSAGRLAMADCDSFASIQYANEMGFDMISTTLSGYTPDTATSSREPNLSLLRSARSLTDVVLLAEGRFVEPWQVRAALQIGANGVVIGGAINDPIKQTRRFVDVSIKTETHVVGIDLGGTWLRAGLFSPNLALLDFVQIAAPETHSERLEFIAEFAEKHNARRIGVSAGGTIEFRTNTVVETKGFIPDYLMKSFRIDGFDVRATNDGLATAWGHGCHPQFAGLRVATLAFGTGVGAGIVHRNRILTDASGNYPRINDAYVSTGKTIEQTLGGFHLGHKLKQTPEFKSAHNLFIVDAAQVAINLISDQFPDVIVICGGVGLSDWFQAAMPLFTSRCPLVTSPYGEHAGLTGAAALQIFPPEGLE